MEENKYLGEIENYDELPAKPLDQKDSFVLASIKTRLISYKDVTVNGNLYPETTLDAAFSDPVVKKMIEGKKFYVEADHPNVEVEKRFKTRLSSPIVGCITEVWKNNEDFHYWGQIDIFDNELGRFIYALLKYGSQLGLSLRMRGEDVPRTDQHGNRYNEVIVSPLLKLYGFDIVINPSSEGAEIPRDESGLFLEDILDSPAIAYLNTTREGRSLNKLLFEDIEEDSDDTIFPEIESTTNTSDSAGKIDHEEEVSFADLGIEDSIDMLGTQSNKKEREQEEEQERDYFLEENEELELEDHETAAKSQSDLLLSIVGKFLEINESQLSDFDSLEELEAILEEELEQMRAEKKAKLRARLRNRVAQDESRPISRQKRSSHNTVKYRLNSREIDPFEGLGIDLKI